jgi:hypothetical protein
MRLCGPIGVRANGWQEAGRVDMSEELAERLANIKEPGTPGA